MSHNNSPARNREARPLEDLAEEVGARYPLKGAASGDAVALETLGPQRSQTGVSVSVDQCTADEQCHACCGRGEG